MAGAGDDQIREVFRVCDKDGGNTSSPSHKYVSPCLSDGILSLEDMQRVMIEFKKQVPIHGRFIGLPHCMPSAQQAAMRSIGLR